MSLIELNTEDGKKLLDTAEYNQYDKMAKYYVHQVHTTVCGIVTFIIAANTLHDSTIYTEETIFDLFGESENQIKSEGLTLSQLSEIVASTSEKSGIDVTAFHTSDSSYDNFMAEIKAKLSNSNSAIAINYHMAMLGQQYEGHFSPIAAYNEKENKVLVMDCWTTNNPFWVDSKDLCYRPSYKIPNSETIIESEGMQAWVVETPGNPGVLNLKEIPIPEPKEGFVLIKIKAFGINRAEMFTRQGASGDAVKFPRVIGIGEVVTGGNFEIGAKVCALMGGMGRQYDGSYAEYTLVPSHIVFPIKTRLTWDKLGAIPEMFQTCDGCLNEALEIQNGETLLIRGGTSSVGLCCLGMARRKGLTVIATTRRKERIQMLKDHGAEHVLIDTGSIQEKLLKIMPNGVDKILELIGTVTLCDSLKCAKKPKGMLGNEWIMNDFNPFRDIPCSVKLTCYSGGYDNLKAEDLQEFVSSVENNSVKVKIDSVWDFSQVVQVHHRMENSESFGKMVVVIPDNN